MTAGQERVRLHSTASGSPGAGAGSAARCSCQGCTDVSRHSHKAACMVASAEAGARCACLCCDEVLRAGTVALRWQDAVDVVCCSRQWVAKRASCWAAVDTLIVHGWLMCITQRAHCCVPVCGNSSRQACLPRCALAVLTEARRQLQHLPGHLLAFHAQRLKPLSQHCILVVVAVVCNRQKLQSEVQ